MTGEGKHSPKSGFWATVKNVLGALCVLDSLATWLPPVLFKDCYPKGITSAHCPAYGAYAPLVESLIGISVTGLIFRFMTLVGLGVDLVSIVYIFKAARTLFVHFRKPEQENQTP